MKKHKEDPSQLLFDFAKPVFMFESNIYSYKKITYYPAFTNSNATATNYIVYNYR